MGSSRCDQLSETGSTTDITETPDLLPEASQQLGFRRPDDGHQDGGNKEKQDTSTAIKKQWHDTESVNIHKTTLRRGALDVEDSALVEETTATIESLRDSKSLKDGDTRRLVTVRDSWLL